MWIEPIQAEEEIKSSPYFCRLPLVICVESDHPRGSGVCQVTSASGGHSVRVRSLSGIHWPVPVPVWSCGKMVKLVGVISEHKHLCLNKT